MGMGTSPNCGYVLKVTRDVLVKFKVDINALARRYDIQENQFMINAEANVVDWGQLIEALLTAMRNDGDDLLELRIGSTGQTRIQAQVYFYDSDDGDRYDDLDNGYYLCFDEDLLYTKKLTELGHKLKRMQVLPEFQMWTNFG